MPYSSEKLYFPFNTLILALYQHALLKLDNYSNSNTQ